MKNDESLYSSYKEALEELKSKSSFREIKDIKQDGKYIILNNASAGLKTGCAFMSKKLLNFSSNDYLGISSNNTLRNDFLQEYLKSGSKISNPSARLLCGTDSIYKELEEFLAKIFNKERALIFNSGYHGNVGVYSSLLSADDVVFVDRLNHASIIDGIRLSKAKIIPYAHLDYEDLKQKLIKYRRSYKKAIISSESLFSMDGDIADINKLADLKEEFNALLIIDEAHSFGVYGGGIGICKEQNALDRVDLLLATFGKAVGSYGAFVAGNEILIDYLINFARSFIFSTTLPEISVAFSYYALKNIILKDNMLQDKLFNLSSYLRKNLKTFDIMGESYIAPVLIGENSNAVRLSNLLIENGFYILPIRYPTVAKNTARLRISLNSGFETADIKSLVDFLNIAPSQAI